MEQPSAVVNDSSRWADAFFFFALLCFCAFVLWLPVFPTGDGPMHIYFSGILWELATRATIYSNYFAIRHLVQPYSLHYFALIGLQRFVSVSLAEKLCVVAVLVCEALGFRYLARQMGRHASLTALLIIPLLLSWALGAGFLNFSFSVAVSLFAFGIWYSLPIETQDHHLPTRALAGFLLCLFLLVLSHPVPLLVLIALAAGDLVLMLYQQWRAARRFSLGDVRWHVIAFAAACIAFTAPAMLADKSQISSIWAELGPHASLIRTLVEGDRVSLFAGTAPLALIYQAIVLAAVPGVLLVQWRSIRKHAVDGGLTPSDRLFVLALLYTLAATCFPRNMNGSAFFAERMWTITWPLILATVAGAPLSIGKQRILAGIGFGWILLTFPLALRTLTPIARKQQILSDAPLPDEERGIFITMNHPDAPPPAWEPCATCPSHLIHTHYNEYSWSGGRAFARHHDIMLNSPWLSLTILPIREKPGARMLMNTMPAQVEDPMILFKAMRDSSSARATALADADFILYADPVVAAPRPLEDVEALLDTDRLKWSCTAAHFYAVCVRAQ